MLSKKMTFSLMSLITIFALAFVAMPVMAATFGGDLVMTRDISHQDGLQLHAVNNAPLSIMIKYAKAIRLDPEKDVFVTIYDIDNDIKFIPAIAAAASDPAADRTGGAIGLSPGKTMAAQEFTFEVPELFLAPAGGALDTSKIVIKIAKDIASADVIDADTTEAKTFTVHVLEVNDGATFDGTTGVLTADTRSPDVLKIALVGEPFATVTTSEFQVHVLLSEDVKKDGLKKDGLDVGDATVKSVTKLASPSDDMPIALVDRTTGNLAAAVNADTLTSWRDRKLHLYLVTLTTKGPGEKTATIKVKDFAGNEKPTVGSQMYTRAADTALVEGRDILTVKTKLAAAVKKEGIRVNLAKDKVIPASGYLVVAEDKGASQIIAPATADDKSPDNTKDSGGQLIYKVIGNDGLPNLETFLNNGGVIDVESPHALVITEIMWGSDASLDAPSKNQWIELYNAGAEYKTKEDDASTAGNEAVTLVFYGPGDTPPALGATGALPAGVTDRVGTIDANGAYWSIAGKGQSGRTGQGEDADNLATVVPTQAVASMNRVMVPSTAPNAPAGSMMVADGTMASSWVQSTPPNINFNAGATGVRNGSPGAMAHAGFTPPTPTPTVEPAAMPAAASDIVITEIMVDTDSGRLPQWIELTSVATGEVSLDGWEIVIDNAIDADVIGGGNAITASLSGVTLGVSAHTGNLGKGQSALVVAWAAPRASANIRADRVVSLATQLNQTRRYQLLSYKGFRITLVPPRTGATIAAFGDIAGNLHEDWEIPMSEGAARSSLIRNEMVAGAATMGTDANGWILADSTSLTIGQVSYYGSDEDAGTPGHDAGGPLPVELSHFRPARDKATGAVVITWSTQSELNNAGFFIKRSQQRNGQFKVINATMVPGAGTTSEKQFYTFTDTTAQPNVVYYYQIEDVSLDGNRQTLTNGIRLKGHIGAAGKLTTSWGELKSIQ